MHHRPCSISSMPFKVSSSSWCSCAHHVPSNLSNAGGKIGAHSKCWIIIAKKIIDVVGRTVIMTSKWHPYINKERDFPSVPLPPQRSIFKSSPIELFASLWGKRRSSGCVSSYAIYYICKSGVDSLSALSSLSSSNDDASPFHFSRFMMIVTVQLTPSSHHI